MKKVKITSICEIQVGKTPSRSNDSYWGDGSRWLSIADMNQGLVLEKTKETITEKAIKECNCKIVPQNTVLFSFKLSIGKVGITKIPMYTNEAIAAFVIKDHSKLDTKFLFYVLKSVDHSIGSNKAVMGKTLNKEQLKKIEIPLPSLEDQKRIVKILDAADALRQKRKQAITLLDDYLKSVFLEIFGDPVTNIKEWNIDTIDAVCDEIVDCVNRTAPIVNYPTEYRMIRTTNVRNYKINFDDTRYASEAIYNKWTRRLAPQKDDIIFTREAPLGEAAIINFDEKVFLGQRTMQFRPNKLKINPIFLLFQLMGPFLKEQMTRLSSGSTVKHLSVPACKKFKILIPPIEAQNSFAEVFKKVEGLKKNMLIQSQELETQFQALMQKAFKGE